MKNVFKNISKKKIVSESDWEDADSDSDLDDWMDQFFFHSFFSRGGRRYRFTFGSGFSFHREGFFRESYTGTGEGSAQGKKEWKPEESEPAEPKSNAQKRREKKQRQKDAQKKFNEGRQFH